MAVDVLVVPCACGIPERKTPLFPGEACCVDKKTANACYVVQAATLDKDGNSDEHIVRQSCAAALHCAGQLPVRKIALPSLHDDDAGISVVGAAKIMAQEILKFARSQASTVKEITLCLADQESFMVFERVVRGYIDHIQDTLGMGPYVTVDVIVEMGNGIVLIERSNPPYGWALPGGFVDQGESLETAVAREAKEETNLDLANLRQLHTYSDPARDPRFHTVTTVFIAKGRGVAQFGDDAKGLRIVAYEELLTREYAFDHKEIIRDYLDQRR